MDAIQKALNEQLATLPRQFLEKIILRKLQAANVHNAKEAAPKLTEHVLAGREDVLAIEDGSETYSHVNIQITREDVAEVERKTADFMENIFPEILQNSTKELAAKFAKDLVKKWPRQAEWEEASLAEFQFNLDVRWGKAISLLQMLLTISREIGEARMKRYARRKRRESPVLHNILYRLHARACQVTDEIVTLLQNGFADGAMARWRTLHEIEVVASVLAQHGEDLARRYADHEVIEAKAAMDDYEKRMVPLGFTPYSAREKKNILKGYDDAVATYGKGFVSSYGWAAHHLNKSKPIFPDLEAAAKHSLSRPYYRMASYNVHASPKGIFFRLGSLDPSGVVLAGRSNAGLADPGAHTAQTLVIITLMLYGPKFTVSDMIQLQAIAQLGEQSKTEFKRADAKLTRDHRRVSNRRSRSSGAR